MLKKNKNKKNKNKKKGFFCFSLNKRTAERVARKRFTYIISRKQRENQPKNTQIEMFSCQLYLAQQKNLVNQSKNKNGPKLDIGWICLKLFNWNTVERNINLESFCMYHKLIIISPWTCTCTYRKTKKINVWLSIGIILIIISYWHNFSFEFLFRH